MCVSLCTTSPNFVLRYDILYAEKQEVEDKFLHYRREVKNTSSGSAAKEVRILKSVVRNLEEELMHEKSKNQRSTSKRNQEYKALLEEVVTGFMLP